MRVLAWAGVSAGTAMTLAGLYGITIVPTTDFYLPV